MPASKLPSHFLLGFCKTPVWWLYFSGVISSLTWKHHSEGQAAMPGTLSIGNSSRYLNRASQSVPVESFDTWYWYFALTSSLNIPHLMLYLCLVRERRMLHIQNWKCSCQKIILLTIQNTHPKIFSSSIFRIDFSSELLKASSARLRGFKYISKLAWF